MPQHDALDRAMSRLDLADRADLAEFLRIQLAAREPIERWVARHCPPAYAPPPQSHLIRADLALLGHAPADHGGEIVLPVDAAPGVAWALGGSSLGNRAMLADLRKRGASVPTAFLSDPAMPAFFARLRPLIERPVSDPAALDAAVAGARAVFVRFAALAAPLPGQVAA